MCAVFLDACVLFPPLVRRILLGAADVGVFQPAWSPRVLEEWRLAAARKQGAEALAEVERVTAAMAARHPGALAVPDPDVEVQITLPDPADAHVLAGAVAAGAPVIATLNLRDFPRPVLARYGIEARHPDSLLWEWFSGDPDRLRPAVENAMDHTGIAPDRARAALKRARLPRFGKAWAGA